MTISTKLLPLCFSATLVMGLAACETQSSVEAAGKTIEQAIVTGDKEIHEASVKLDEQSDSIGVTMDDTVITTKVKEAIFAEPGLKTLQISVSTKNSVATLSGSVDSQKNSDRAKEVAAMVAGVTSVENLLVIKSIN